MAQKTFMSEEQPRCCGLNIWVCIRDRYHGLGVDADWALAFMRRDPDVPGKNTSKIYPKILPVPALPDLQP